MSTTRRPRSWLAILVTGLVAALFAAPMGVDIQGAVMVAACVLSVICLPLGVKRWKPERRGPWMWLTLSLAILVGTSVLRVAGVGADLHPLSAPDLAAALAYLTLGAGFYQLGRLRANDQDPTGLVDAVILTAAVGVTVWALFVLPFVNNGMSSSAHIGAVVFASLDLVIFFAVARLAIGPGARTPSFYLTAGVAVAILLSDLSISASQASMSFVGAGVLPLFFPTAAFVLSSAAAMHPTMREITRAGTVGMGRATSVRITLMTIATIAPPVVILLGYVSSQRGALVYGLGPVAIAITVMVMARFAGLARARERMAETERRLADISATLAGATNENELNRVAVRGSTELLQGSVRHHATAVLRLDSKGWRTVQQWPTKDAVPLPQDALNSLIDRARTGEFGAVWDDSARTDSGSGRLLVPLVSQNRVLGALLLEVESSPAPTILTALSTMATHVGLALEAAVLTEDLHRRRSDRRFKALVEASSDLIVVVSERDGITFMSPTAESLLGGRNGDVRALLAAVHDEDRLAVLTLLQTASNREDAPLLECRMLDVDGEVRWYEATARDMSGDEAINGVVFNAHDVTGRKRAEEELRHEVFFDSLTGIANRSLFRDRLSKALQRRKPAGEQAVVLAIDLDDFKTINDGLGHNTGDEVLKIIAFRLSSYLRTEDTCARTGGDEFAVLIEDVLSDDDAFEVAERLKAVIQEPIDFDGMTYSVTASIGIASESSSTDTDIVLRNADAAMYHAKQNGKSAIKVFDNGMYERAIRRLELKADLVHAVERNELVLNFQPLVDLATDMPTGFESLLRWNHPTKGFVSPVDFIPLAEETGLIVPIGAWVLNESLRELARWGEQGPHGNMKISINVSPVQMASLTFVSEVADALAASGVDASQVTLELTETAILDDAVTLGRLTELRQLGVGLAADDFGSGFASYAALQRMPVTTVKIDRSLITELSSETSVAAAQVRSIVDMAHETGMSVVVEGIEDMIQRNILKNLGCDRGQGYFFSRPMPAKDVAQWVAARLATGSRIH